jgi:hypothetical protein
LKPYDNPFWRFEQRYQEEQQGQQEKINKPKIEVNQVAPLVAGTLLGPINEEMVSFSEVQEGLSLGLIFTP